MHTTDGHTGLTAHPGDRLIVRGGGDQGSRDAEIVSTGPDGHPPFTVRWSDTGHEAVVFPGSGAEVHHHGHVETQH